MRPPKWRVTKDSSSISHHSTHLLTFFKQNVLLGVSIDEERLKESRLMI